MITESKNMEDVYHVDTLTPERQHHRSIQRSESGTGKLTVDEPGKPAKRC